MNKNKNKKKILLITSFLFVLVSIIVTFIGNSFGFFKYLKKGDIVNIITIGGIRTAIVDEENNALQLEDLYPVDDSVGLSQTPFVFSMTNTSNKNFSYSILVQNDEEKMASCKLDDGTACPELSTDYIKYAYKKNDGSYTEPRNLGADSNVITSGIIAKDETITSSIILWIDSEAGNEIQGHYFYGKIIIMGAATTSTNYEEEVLNGAVPVLTDNLVPVQIASNGTVTKANIQEEWYSYKKKNWANAVVLKTNENYENNQVIPEDNIESYFVWIPRYKYKIFDEGSYTGLTSIGNSVKPIEVIFENKDKTQATGTKVDNYLTHPAFTAFDTNGIWVGKFETGYDGATSTTAAEVDSNDSSRIIIKPNVYSWRNATVGNMFKASYDYLRNDESHMMKNTEWGAVAYLSHSKYGTCINGQCNELRINNNSSYITGYAGTEAPTKGYNGGTSTDGNRVEGTALATDGTYTVNYLNSSSNVASTTGNKTGVYDMSGGAWEYVMGYTTGASTVGGSSGITDLYSDFYTNSAWNKYYDEYSSTSYTNYNNRILGDATGEMGPFGIQIDPDNCNRFKSSWYGDYAPFVHSSGPWFTRGGDWIHGSSSGVFAFYDHPGGVYSFIGFRVVLAPTK